MPKLQKISYAAINLGEALPWPVYDVKGQLLLEKGFVVETENQLETLIAKGLFLTEEDAGALADDTDGLSVAQKSCNPFADLKAWLMDLNQGYSIVSERRPEALATMNTLLDRVIELCEQDPDACLAMVHIHAVEPSPAQQTLFYIVLTQLMAKRLDFDEARSRSLVAAAMTANISLMPYQERLNQSNGPLTDKLREIINKHPNLSATLLRQCGVTDELWLHIVEQHHESFDGTGYPAGLTAADILPEAKLLGLIEMYTALVTVRGYRKRFRPEEALREIVVRSQKDREDPLYETFFKELSKYPPGTFVKLANGEIAIVIRREERGQVPLVKAVINSGGSPYLAASLRDSRQKEFRVTESVVPEFIPLLNLPLLWDYV